MKITQTDLSTIITYAKENPNVVEKFLKPNPTCAIIVNEDNQQMLTERLEIVKNGKYPSVSINENAIPVGTRDNVDYKDVYFDKSGMIIIGTAIMINILEDGELDIYPNSDITKAYVDSEAEVVAIPNFSETLQAEVSMFQKLDTVDMIKFSTVKEFLGKEDSNGVEATWGTQELDSESYIIFNADEVYGINLENELPIGYVRA